MVFLLQSEMGKTDTFHTIKSIHDNLVAQYGINSDKLTARVIRRMLEKKHNKKRNAYKRFRARLYTNYIIPIHDTARRQ